MSRDQGPDKMCMFQNPTLTTNFSLWTCYLHSLRHKPLIYKKGPQCLWQRTVVTLNAVMRVNRVEPDVG